MKSLWLALTGAAVALLAVLGYRWLSRRGPYALRRSTLQPIVVSDRHWDLVCAERDFADFEPGEFCDLHDVLRAAQNTLSYARGDAAPLLPRLAGADVWDTSDDNSWDFILSVEVNRWVSLSSSVIRIQPFTELGTGPDAARTVLNELLAERNLLVAHLARSVPA